MTRTEVISLFPNGVQLGVGISDPRHPVAALYAEEEDGIGRAVPKRVNEFRAGRAAARCAMRELGMTEEAVPVREDRTPVWPKGLAGSISHCDDMCIAVVSCSLQSLGVDIEPATGLEADLWDEILLPAEQTALGEAQNPALFAKMVFSAKEAAYKAQYPLSQSLFGFRDLKLNWGSDGSFSATFLGAAGPFAVGDSLAGRFAMCGDHIVTGVAIA